MANKTVIKTVFQLRRASTAEWEQYKEVVPACGEPCFDYELGTLKIGDGKKTYGELEAIGGHGSVTVAADGKSIVLADGVFKLAGFDAAEIGAQPRKGADGSIEWVVPSTETVDGLKTAVAGLQKDVRTIQEIIIPSGEGEQPLLTRVETIEGQIGVLNGDASVEGSVLKVVTDEINKFATQMSDDGTVNTFKELINYVADHGGTVESLVADITHLQSLVGNEAVSDQIANAISASNHLTKEEAAKTLISKVEAGATFKKVKYEIVGAPTGTLVDYREKEIRVMCADNTAWKHQASGENADKNKYYIGLKAYAPDGAVSFKEDIAEIIADDTMHTFDNNQFAGTDAYGRKYSIIWIPVANYDVNTDTWTYYGEKSSTSKYLGWYYSVEWYGADGVKIDTDCIRVNLSNEGCHNAVEPYYMANVIKEVSINGTLMDVVNGRVNITSDEIDIADDGTLSVKAISFDKIIQSEDTVVVMDGGSAVI